MSYRLYQRRDIGGSSYFLYFSHAGKRVRQSLKTTDREVAERKARLIYEKETSAGEVIGLGELIRKYIVSMRLTNKPGTCKAKAYYLMQFAKSTGDRQASEITRPEIIKYMEDLHLKGCGKVTYNRTLAYIHHLFNYGIDLGFLQANPAAKIKHLKEKPRERFLTDSERARLIKRLKEMAATGQTANQRLLYPIVLTALLTGMRKSEILHLKWFDLRDGFFVIHRKGDKKTLVPAPDCLLHELKQLSTDDEYIFPVKYRRESWGNILFQSVLKSLKINGFRFHDLRHTAAYNLARLGTPANTIKAILGHSSLAMTQIYSHSSRDDERAAVENMAREIM